MHSMTYLAVIMAVSYQQDKPQKVTMWRDETTKPETTCLKKNKEHKGN